jgi:hypothetical protein
MENAFFRHHNDHLHTMRLRKVPEEPNLVRQPKKLDAFYDNRPISRDSIGSGASGLQIR